MTKVRNNGIAILNYGTERKSVFLDGVKDFNGLSVKEMSLNKAKSPTFGDNVVVVFDNGAPIRLMGADIINGSLVVNGTDMKEHGEEKGIDAKVFESLNERSFTATLKGGKLYLQEAKISSKPKEKQLPKQKKQKQQKLRK